jgi:hypothetical protein
MKLVFAALAGFVQMLSFGALAAEVEERKTGKAKMVVNQALSGKTATTYVRTPGMAEQQPQGKFVINQALSGKTALVYVRVPQ